MTAENRAGGDSGMLVTIRYCKVCNYRPIAARLAIDLKQEFACEVAYEPGPSGVFDVMIDGVTLFSKFEVGNRFPKKGEIISLIKQAQSASS